MDEKRIAINQKVQMDCSVAGLCMDVLHYHVAAKVRGIATFGRRSEKCKTDGGS